MSSATVATADLLASGTDISDEDVVARVRAGDTPLFELLMRRHNQRLYRVARSILRDESEIDGVLQETYVRAFTHLDQFLGRARFSTWLTRIAVHEALHRRKRKRPTVIWRTSWTSWHLRRAGPRSTRFRASCDVFSKRRSTGYRKPIGPSLSCAISKA